MAGIAAATTILMYGIPVNSAIMKAAAPITGGMICPPVEAAASTAPAKYGLYPVFFIRGMVNAPVVTVFATELPDTDPINPLATTAVIAGPLFICPVNA